MTYQIDQSGKIEQTNKKTVLVAVDGQSYAVILAAKEKRRLQELFRRQGKPQLFVDAIFTTLLYFLIRQFKEKTPKIEVDTEYSGHTKVIYQMLSLLLKKEISLRWILVGKSSMAHDLAYKIYKKKLKLGKVVRFVEIAKLAIKIAGGRLNTGLSPANRRSAPANKYIITQKKRLSR